MKLCDTCTYGDKTEYFKPCIIYRDDCEYYERKDVFIADQCECENCIHEEMCKWKEERHGQECAYMEPQESEEV